MYYIVISTAASRSPFCRIMAVIYSETTVRIKSPRLQSTYTANMYIYIWRAKDNKHYIARDTRVAVLLNRKDIMTNILSNIYPDRTENYALFNMRTTIILGGRHFFLSI